MAVCRVELRAPQGCVGKSLSIVARQGKGKAAGSDNSKDATACGISGVPGYFPKSTLGAVPFCAFPL